MSYKVYSLFTFLVLLSSCNKNPKDNLWLKEDIYMYEAIEIEKTEFVKGKTTYKQSKIYDDQERLRATWYYNDKGEVSFIDQQDSSNLEYPTHSTYYNSVGEIQSIYKNEYKNQKLIHRYAMDPINNKVLKSESFEYKNDKRIKKIVRDSIGKIINVFSFTFDSDGNEISLSLLANDKSVLSYESYSITNKYDDGSWKSKTAFKADQPIRFLERNCSKIRQIK